MCSKKIFFKNGTTLVVSFLFFVTVSFSQKSNLQTGIWRGTLELNDSTELPFNFDVKYDLGFYSVVFHNAEERIEANEIALKSDSVFIKMPFFDSEFRCKNLGDSLKGIWINHAKKTKNIISFSAKNNKSNRFTFQPTPPILSTERYKVIFEPGTKDEYFSVGSFASENGRTKGTFTTETGDYRYLEGYSANGKFVVSCFDGSHAFLFSAIKKNDSLIKGVFYSGISGHENWVAIKDDTFELRNPDSLTFLKPGYTKFDFNFKNLEGQNVSIQDDKFKNKVVIIQIMGSWCPNCMDETKFLASFYDAYKPKGLEVIGLAFERADDFAKAVNNINRMKNRFHANYEFLITMKTGADQASEALPMLNNVMAFPTSIYIDKKGVVRKIYTGFYGPATGEKYTQYIEDTKIFVEKLIAE